MIPYINLNKSNSSIDRIFKSDIESEDLRWHRDLEDRILYPNEETDWMIQMDNELPKPIEPGIYIPAGAWHRLIKGSGELKIKIEINNIEYAQSKNI
jgi:hypothetical protein